MLTRDRFFIGGAWVAPSTKHTTEVFNAGNGERMGRVPLGEEKDIDAAVSAARNAFEGWSGGSAQWRSGFLDKISAGLKARADELAKLIAQEVGMPLKLAARIQVGLPIANFANYAKIAREFRFEEKVGNSLVVREPVGVVGAITPWNYPLHQIALKVAPALAAGCTVVLKPSEIAPLNAFVLAEVIEIAGLPKGVFNVVTGLGPAVRREGCGLAHEGDPSGRQGLAARQRLGDQEAGPGIAAEVLGVHGQAGDEEQRTARGVRGIGHHRGERMARMAAGDRGQGPGPAEVHEGPGPLRERGLGNGGLRRRARRRGRPDVLAHGPAS